MEQIKIAIEVVDHGGWRLLPERYATVAEAWEAKSDLIARDHASGYPPGTYRLALPPIERRYSVIDKKGRAIGGRVTFEYHEQEYNGQPNRWGIRDNCPTGWMVRIWATRDGVAFGATREPSGLGLSLEEARVLAEKILAAQEKRYLKQFSK